MRTESGSQKGVKGVVGMLLQAAVHQHMHHLPLLWLLQAEPGHTVVGVLDMVVQDQDAGVRALATVYGEGVCVFVCVCEGEGVYVPCLHVCVLRR